MKSAVYVGLVLGLLAAGRLYAQEQPAAEQPAAAEPAPQPEGPPPDPAQNIIARFDFDSSVQPDNTTGFGMPVFFKRESGAFVDGKEVAPHVPRLVAGKFGKGLLLEDAFANYLAPNQADAEKDTGGFTPLNGATLTSAAVQPWQGGKALHIQTPGAGPGEGFAVETKVDQAYYNGNAAVPAVYVASIYLKGQGNLQLHLQDAVSGTNGAPVYVDLTPDWKRYACAFICAFAPTNLGPKHEEDWKTLLPPETPVETRLQMLCATMDSVQIAFDADGLQVEHRRAPYSNARQTLSPLAWIPGGTKIAQEEFSFGITNDFFNKWTRNGSLSFWFKPGWEAQDVSQELMLQLGNNVMLLQHTPTRIRMYPAGMEFTPTDWRDLWHHIAITWNQDGERIVYVDGLDYPNESGDKKPVYDAISLVLSAAGAGNAPNGVVDELVLYQITLTPEQAKAMAAADQPIQPASGSFAPAPAEQPVTLSVADQPPAAAAVSAPAAGAEEKQAAPKTEQAQPEGGPAAVAPESDSQTERKAAEESQENAGPAE